MYNLVFNKVNMQKTLLPESHHCRHCLRLHDPLPLRGYVFVTFPRKTGWVIWTPGIDIASFNSSLDTLFACPFLCDNHLVSVTGLMCSYPVVIPTIWPGLAQQTLVEVELATSVAIALRVQFRLHCNVILSTHNTVVVKSKLLRSVLQHIFFFL